MDQQCSADLPTFCKLSHVDVCVKEIVCYIMSGKVGWLIMVPHICNLYVHGGCESVRDPSRQILAVKTVLFMFGMFGAVRVLN